MSRLVFVLLSAIVLSACRGQSAPAASNPLPEPVTAYPDQAKPAPADGIAGAQKEPTAEKSAAADTVIWEHLGQWSGMGSIQTESFTGQTGALRFKWQTKAVKGKPEGTFLLTVHSAISGRPLQVAVDQRGPGGDTAFINEDPRVFFAVVEAENIEWSFSVDEAIGTRRVTK